MMDGEKRLNQNADETTKYWGKSINARIKEEGYEREHEYIIDFISDYLTGQFGTRFNKAMFISLCTENII